MKLLVKGIGQLVTVVEGARYLASKEMADIKVFLPLLLILLLLLLLLLLLILILLLLLLLILFLLLLLLLLLLLPLLLFLLLLLLLLLVLHQVREPEEGGSPAVARWSDRHGGK